MDLSRFFGAHCMEAALIVARLNRNDIVHLALSSRAIGFAVPRCMLRAAELDLLSWRVESDTRRRIDGVPFTWPYPGRSLHCAAGPPSPFASWREAFAAEDRAASTEDGISRLVRWTIAIKSPTTAYDHEKAYFCIDHVARVDSLWSPKGDHNWWLDKSERKRAAERERRADEAILSIKASVRYHATRLKVAARTQSDPCAVVAHLHRDTAQLIYDSAFRTHFACDHLRDHFESVDEVALSCGLGPPLRTAQERGPDRRFFDDTIDHTVNLLIDRQPPPGVGGHGAQTINAVLTLVERWCPHMAFVDRTGALSNAGAISSDGPEGDVGDDEWTTTEPDGDKRTVFRNSLRAHLRKRLPVYAPYLCPVLVRLCVAASIIARACRVGDRAVVTAVTASFAADMEPHAIALALGGALSQGAIAHRAFADRVGPNAIPEAKAARAVAVNTAVIVRLLVRALEAIADLVAAYPEPSEAECRLASSLFGVADAIVARIVWTPGPMLDSSLTVADGRIRMKHVGVAWTTCLTDVRLRMKRANRSLMLALFGAADVDAWARVIAQPRCHPFRRLLIAGECIHGPLPTHMASVTHMVLRAIQNVGDRSYDEARGDADRARRVLVAFGRAIGTPAEALAACDALAALYHLPPPPLPD